jgi:hypothetical protein
LVLAWRPALLHREGVGRLAVTASGRPRGFLVGVVFGGGYLSGGLSDGVGVPFR